LALLIRFFAHASLIGRHSLELNMDKRTYNLIIGVILLLTAIAFLMMPAFLSMDPMIPVIISIVCFVVALVFFFSGGQELINKI